MTDLSNFQCVHATLNADRMGTQLHYTIVDRAQAYVTQDMSHVKLPLTTTRSGRSERMSDLTFVGGSGAVQRVGMDGTDMDY